MLEKLKTWRNWSANVNQQTCVEYANNKVGKSLKINNRLIRRSVLPRSHCLDSLFSFCNNRFIIINSIAILLSVRRWLRSRLKNSVAPEALWESISLYFCIASNRTPFGADSPVIDGFVYINLTLAAFIFEFIPIQCSCNKNRSFIIDMVHRRSRFSQSRTHEFPIERFSTRIKIHWLT